MNNTIQYLGSYFISLVIILYTFFAIILIRQKKQPKFKRVLFSFLVILISDLIAKQVNHIQVYYFHFILLTYLFLILSTLSYKDYVFTRKKKDVLLFIIATLTTLAIFIINTQFTIISDYFMPIVILLYQLVTLIIICHIYINYYRDYPYKIGIKIKLTLLLYLLSYILLTVLFSFNVTLRFGSYHPLNAQLKESLYIFYWIIETLFYLLLVIFGLFRIVRYELGLIKQFINFSKLKENEFKILDIIQNLVLKSEDFDSTIDSILNIATYLTQCDGAVLYIYDENTGYFYAKKIRGYLVPLYFVHDKILEDQDKIIKKILSTHVSTDVGIFKSINEIDDVLLINREAGDPSRKPLKYLRDYANNIGSILAGKILVDNQLYGILILEKLYSNFIQTDINMFTALSSFSGVLISNINSRAMEKEKERLENEMKIAEKIQTGMLPKNYLIPGYTISAFMKPADEVGGDYYDIIAAPDGNYWVNIGDVTGHGVTAGLIMMMLQTSAISTINTNPSITPDQLAVISNKIMFDNIQNRLLLDQFITTCFFKFRKDGSFEFAGAHEEILIYRSASQKVEKIKTEGIWLGLLDDISHGTTLGTFQLDQDDVLLIFTDGVIEIQDKESNQYDLPRLVQFLEKNGAREPDNISEALINELENFKYIQKDDITYVIIKKDQSIEG